LLPALVVVSVDREFPDGLRPELFDFDILCLNRYSLLFASRGANVIVNDSNATAAQKVVDEITKGTYFCPSCLTVIDADHDQYLLHLI